MYDKKNTEPNREIDPQKITTKDLIYLYLREIDVLQNSLSTLEKRISTDIKRIEIDMRQHCVTNDDYFKELRDNHQIVLDQIGELWKVTSKIKDIVHSIEMSNTTTDQHQNSRIENIEVKVAIYSIISTIASFIGMQGIIELAKFITDTFH
jgi:hypothetical protein